MLKGANLHGPCRTGGHTKATDTALLVIEDHTHFWPLNRQRASGTDCCARAAMGALVLVSVNILAYGRDLYALLLQVSNPSVEVFFVPREFQNHDALFAGQYGCLEDVECQVVIGGEIADDRLAHLCF